MKVSGTIHLDFTLEVSAGNEAEAKEKAIMLLNEMYHLDTNGAYHDPDEDVSIDIYSELDLYPF